MGNVAVIGGGVAGLAAACALAKDAQHRVTLYEKNSSLGGRGRSFSANGFTFDMGPSWYWMPDIFEDFFAAFGATSSEFYELKRLDPAFRLVFSHEDVLDIPGTEQGIVDLCSRLEPGAGARLTTFFEEAKIKYEIGVKALAYKPCRSLTEFLDLRLIKNLHRLHLLKRFDRYVASFFTDRRLRTLMEFPILFLGTLPSTTPAMYSFMNYGGFAGGTWYPQGGMIRIALAMEELAKRLRVEVHTESAVTAIRVSNCRAEAITVNGVAQQTDGIVASADYSHVDQMLLPTESRRYTTEYWNKRVLAPSSYILYLGLSCQVERLLHHTLFFDADFPRHSRDLTTAPRWPEDPLFYVSCPSKTDPSVAPEGAENLFILVPLAAGLPDTPELRAALRDKVLTRLERFTGCDIRNHTVFERGYCISDFQNDYNALKGNAYGLANTLRQTAIGKPQMISSKVKNLVYAGQLTVPGPGLPPSLISGQIAAKELTRLLMR